MLARTRAFTVVAVWVLSSNATAWGADATAPPAVTAAPAITVLGDDAAAKVAPKATSDAAHVKVMVLGQGTAVSISEVKLVADDATSAKVKDFQPHSAGSGITSIDVELSGLKKLKRSAVDGQLVMTFGSAGGPQTRVTRAVEITPAPTPHPPGPFGTWTATILVATFVTFALLVLAPLGFGGDKHLMAKAPGPKWSFDSWGTTLTTIGAALGTVLGAATYPPVPDQISKNSLIQLNLMFGVMVLVGPLLFQALRRVHEQYDPEELFGWNLTLLLACGITGAAVIGEVMTLGLLGWELAGPGDWGWVPVGAAAVVAVLSAWYFFSTTYALIRTDWEALKTTADAAAAQPQEVVVVVRHPEGLDAFLAGTAGQGDDAKVLPLPYPVVRPRASWPLP